MAYLANKSVAAPVWLFPPIIDWYDPTDGLPVDPEVGDRYGSDATAGGWTIDYIYEWDGISWIESAPEDGWMIWDLFNLILWAFFSGGWMEVGSETFVPYSGANSDTDLGEYSLNAKYITGKKVGVYAYLTEPTGTTITTAGTFYPIGGSFTNAPVEGFGVAITYTPGIKYTETLTQFFEIDWHTSVSASVNTTTVTLAISKNGTLIPGSDMLHLCKNSDQTYNLSGTCVVELAEGDEIQLIVTSNGDGDVLTIHKYTTTINEFFD